jgi:hypothetical protein
LRLPSEELLELPPAVAGGTSLAPGEDNQLRVAAIDQRQLGHLFLLDDRAECHGDGVNDRRGRSDGDGFLHRRRSEREVHDGLAADHQTDALTKHGLKSRQ